MAQASSIEWTQATWNPIAGCAVVSPGCTNCYAMKMAARHEAMSTAQGRVSPYDGLTKKTKAGAVWNGEMRLVEPALDLPITWIKPRTIFVNSMSDLFADGVPDAWIDQVFARMAVTYRHTYQVLTKRSARMRAYLTDPATPGRIWDLVDGGKHALINAPRRLRKGMTESGTSGAQSKGDVLTRALALASAPKPKQSGRNSRRTSSSARSMATSR